MEKFVLAIDQGTTSSRAVIFNRQLHKIAAAQREFPQHFPLPGWVEHNPYDILRSVLSVINEAIVKAGIAAEQHISHVIKRDAAVEYVLNYKYVLVVDRIGKVHTYLRSSR